MDKKALLKLVFNILAYGTIVVSGAIVFMVMVGMIQLPTEKEKSTWVEINSQILNGIFTVLAIGSLPWRLVHFKRCQKSPWSREATIVSFQLANSITQIPITIVMWGFSSSTRPNIVIAVFVPLSFGCIVTAGILEWRQKKMKKNGEEGNNTMELEQGMEPKGPSM